MQPFGLGQSLLVVLPELGLGALSFIVLLLDLRWTEAQRKNIAVVSAVGLGLLAVITLLLTPDVIKQVALQANPDISQDVLAKMSFWGGMIRYDCAGPYFQGDGVGGGCDHQLNFSRCQRHRA